MSQNSFVVLNSGGGEETVANNPNSEWALLQEKDDGSVTVNAFVGKKSEDEYDNCESGSRKEVSPPGPGPVDPILHSAPATGEPLPPAAEGPSSAAEKEKALQVARELEARAECKKHEEEEEKKNKAAAAKQKAERDLAAKQKAEQEARKRELEAQAEQERKAHAARVQKEKDERAAKLKQENEAREKRDKEAWLAKCQYDRAQVMRSEEEARYDAIADLLRADEVLHQKDQESRWRAEQDRKEREEIEAVAAAADEASRQRLSDQMENKQNRACQCLGASSGVHRPGCPKK